MKIAIVGAGISGLVCAYILGRSHEIELYEAQDYAGGHTHTHSLSQDGEAYSIDTGFIVFNEANYPNFTQLLKKLDVASQDTLMSFSVQCEQSGIEYNGAGLNELFIQRRNLIRPSFYRMLAHIVRFGKEAPRLLESNANPTVEDFVMSKGYSKTFRDLYLYPMCAALWSAPFEQIKNFPARSMVSFFQNHGMLNINDRPQWRVIKGGSSQYVAKISSTLGDRLHLNSPISAITRQSNGASLVFPDAKVKSYDHVILATHSDQALRLLHDKTELEQNILGAIPYQVNDISLHTDESILPKRKAAWASWNYKVPKTSGANATVTYDMNILQSLNSTKHFCTSLNSQQQIAPDSIIKELKYEHPIFYKEGAAAQKRYLEIGSERTHFCGAYWGHGFHEDGVKSALRVCELLGEKL